MNLCLGKGANGKVYIALNVKDRLDKILSKS